MPSQAKMNGMVNSTEYLGMNDSLKYLVNSSRLCQS
jgi:hypothetical protein